MEIIGAMQEKHLKKQQKQKANVTGDRKTYEQQIKYEYKKKKDTGRYELASQQKLKNTSQWLRKRVVMRQLRN